MADSQVPVWRNQTLSSFTQIRVKYTIERGIRCIMPYNTFQGNTVQPQSVTYFDIPQIGSFIYTLFLTLYPKAALCEALTSIFYEVSYQICYLGCWIITHHTLSQLSNTRQKNMHVMSWCRDNTWRRGKVEQICCSRR